MTPMNFDNFLKKWKAILTIPFKYIENGKGLDYSPPEFFTNQIDNVKIGMSPNKFTNILNIGAGAGVETKLLAEAGYNVIGTTLGEDNLKYGRDTLGVELVEMEMHNLEFPDKIFDGVVEIQCYEHAFIPWLHTLELRRVLRDGGRVYIDVPCPDAGNMMDNIWHVNCLYPKQQDIMFKKAGFRVVEEFTKYTKVYEKIHDGGWELWGYVEYIMQYMK